MLKQDLNGLVGNCSMRHRISNNRTPRACSVSDGLARTAVFAELIDQGTAENEVKKLLDLCF